MNKNDLIIIDCEASGLNTDSYPIEIGLAFKNKSSSFLIKPAEDWNYWNMDSENIHKIKRDVLIEKGLTVFESVNILNNELKGLTVYSDAVDFETFWIDKLFSKVGVNRNFEINSIYMLSFDVMEYRNFKFKYSKNMELHRAENDAILIRKSILSSLN